MRRFSAISLIAVALFGCSRSGSPETGSQDLRSTGAKLLVETDMQRFLAVVQEHDAALIPEFTPPDDDEAPDFSLPAKEIVSWFRGKFRDIYDVERQGAVWNSDPQWNRALEAHKISGQQFASLTCNVSLAIMRVRLEARGDVDQLVANAKREVKRAHGVLDEIDAVPPKERTRESRDLRSSTALELGRAVALLEFAELIHQVPADNTALIRRYSRKLKSLLPAHANEDLLAELGALARREADTIVPAGYETDAPQKTRLPVTTRGRTK